jgi:hypothetical protein
LGFPGPDGKRKTHKIIINDDDCALNLADFAGTYLVNDVSLAVFDPRQYSSSVSVGTQPNTLVVTNFYQPTDGWADAVSVPVIIAIDPATLTATVPDQVAYNRASGPRRAVTDDLEPGVVLTCSKTFKVNAYIYNPATGAAFDIVELTFTKQ